MIAVIAVIAENRELFVSFANERIKRNGKRHHTLTPNSVQTWEGAYFYVPNAISAKRFFVSGIIKLGNWRDNKDAVDAYHALKRQLYAASIEDSISGIERFGGRY